MQKEKKEKNLIHLRSAGIDDMKKVFLWRNHPDVRKNFFNTNPVAWDEHEKWFREKSQDPDTTIYMAFNADRCVGTIRFEKRGQVVQCSVMVNPDFIGCGFGAQIIASGARKYLAETESGKTIIAEIKVENTSSFKVFRRAGFKDSYVTCIFEEKDNLVEKPSGSLQERKS